MMPPRATRSRSRRSAVPVGAGDPSQDAARERAAQAEREAQQQQRGGGRFCRQGRRLVEGHGPHGGADAEDEHAGGAVQVVAGQGLPGHPVGVPGQGRQVGHDLAGSSVSRGVVGDQAQPGDRVDCVRRRR